MLVHRRFIDDWDQLPNRVGLEAAQQFYDHVATSPGQIPAVGSATILKGSLGKPLAEGFSRTVHYEISGAGRIDFQYHDTYISLCLIAGRLTDMTVGQRRLTLEEFLELPEESPALELIDGMVTQKVAPQWLHGLLQVGFAGLINDYARPRKLAIEIVSPGQSVAELLDKGRRYLAHGVPTVVVVEPNGESVVVLRAGGSIATLRGEDRIDLDAVLPGFELTVRALFDTLQLE
ncbi:MAG: Uma2 family endonuclease [Chloroflexi bacterium]|nr:Uma2 family endonuclease [Chloroflexota bacterium]